MPELTNLLRQRFASVPEPEVHPDADILTAYVEQLLATRERKNVLEHLAVCGQCREVILLLGAVQPAAADSAVPVTSSLRPERRWRAFSWRAFSSRSALGLAASLAGLAIVTTLIVEMPHGTMQVKKSTGNPIPAASPVNSLPAAPANEPASTDSVSTASNALKDATPAPGQARDGRAANSPQGVAAGSAEPRARAKSSPVTVAGGPYINVEMFTNDASLVVPLVDLPSAPPPHISNQAQNTLLSSIPLSAAPAPYDISTGKTLRMVTPNSGSGHMIRWSLVTNLGKEATKPLFHNRTGSPIAVYRINDSAMIHPGLFTAASELGPSEASASSISENGRGELARSGAFTAPALSAGNTELVNGNDINNASGARAAGVRPAWKIADGKLLKMGSSGSWTESYPSADGIEFSVVTNWGSDVWAGGSNAAVVHSRDGGASWERITLGASATGTIHNIEASGLKIVVRSSSGQSWLSADGGKSWTLQD